jgi:methionyl-tRNA synthetase
VVKLISMTLGGPVPETAGLPAAPIYTEVDAETTVKQVQTHIEACQYNRALERIWLQVFTPANQYLDRMEPWKLARTDLAASKRVLYDLAEQLRIGSILIKPFLPRAAETKPLFPRIA